MKPSTAHQRREKTLRQAVMAMYNGMSVRKAAATYRLPKTTVHEAFYKPIIPRVAPQHRRGLTDSEEKQIAALLHKCSDRGAPLTRTHVQEAVRTLVSRMTVSRRISLPFANGNPGSKFFRGFMKRHKEELKYIKPLKQEHERFKAVNADALCEHFATLEKLIADNNLGPDRIWNLDECGVTPGRDANGRSQSKRIMRRNGGEDIRVTAFSYDKRITFMPVISAAGGTGPCLFVFKGKTFPYRVTLVDGKEKIDTVANHLPDDAGVTMREEGGGVDQHNFLEWAYHFVVSIRPLTKNGRKVLLIYDGYRSHMSLSVLRLFADNNALVYALPSHSSGKTQPLDVVAFSVFKRKLNQLMYSTSDRFIAIGATVYDTCDMLTTAYNETFTVRIIRSSFHRSGIWPVDPKMIMSVPRPVDGTLEAVATVETMEQMMQERRVQLATSIFGERATVLDNGFVDTTKGAVLTTDSAIELVSKRAKAQREAKKQEEVLRQLRLQRAPAREKRQRKQAQASKDNADFRRAVMAGMDVGVYKRQLRTLKERRAAARVRTAEKRASGGG